MYRILPCIWTRAHSGQVIEPMGRDRGREDWAAWLPGRGAAGQQRPDPAPAAPAVAVKADATAPSLSAMGVTGSSAAGVDGRAPAAGRRAASARREATRRRVIDAARDVFAERGVMGGTIEDICERAGFTRGAFYSNFGDKDDLLAALVEVEHADRGSRPEEAPAPADSEPAGAANPAAAVAPIVERILRSVRVDRRTWLVQAELEIQAVRRPELARPPVEIDAAVRDRIGALVVEALARNGLELTVDPADLGEAALAVIGRSARRALLAGGAADPDAMARSVLSAMLLGLSRPAAR